MSQSKITLSKASARHEFSGVAFIGSPSDSFHMIIRCPIHVYCVIKKALNLFDNPPHTTFCSGSIPITDLALPRFIGTFIYRRPTDNKIQKFNAAFIFPTCCNEDDFSSAWRLYQALSYCKYEFVNKQTDKKLKTLLSEVSVNSGIFADIDFSALDSSISGVS